MERLSINEDGSGARTEAVMKSLVNKRRTLKDGRRGGIIVNQDDITKLQQKIISDEMDALLNNDKNNEGGSGWERGPDGRLNRK